MKSNLIKLSLILIINFFVIETSYSIEPTKFVQQTVNKASNLSAIRHSFIFVALVPVS